MHRTRTISLALAIVVTTSWQAPLLADAIDDLLMKVPDQTNALVLIDLKTLYASPLAQREGWSRKHHLDILGGSFPFPPRAESALLAAHLQPGSLKSTWDLGLVRGGQQPTMAELAKRDQGVEENLAGAPSVLTGKNSFFVGIAPQILATYSPAHRQDVARWIRFAQKNSSPVISPYLTQAAADIKNGYHVVVALDMADSVDPNVARKFLAQSPILKGKNIDIDALVRVLSSARGIRIGIRVDQLIRATLAGDFGEEIKPFAEVLPQLVLKALDDMGADLDEFSPAAAAIQDKNFLISTQLSIKGFRNVMQLVSPVMTSIAMEKEPAPAPEAKAPPIDPKSATSKRYFSMLIQYANEAHNTAEKKNDFIRAAMAYEKAASQIDKLSVINVDEELITYSNSLSSKLRSIADALRASVLEAVALENEKTANVQVVPGGYITGYTIGPWNPSFPGDPRYPQGVWARPWITPPQYNVQTNEAQVQGKQAEALSKGAKKRLELWRLVTNETSAIRKKMAAKYQLEF